MKTNPENISELLQGPDHAAHRQVLAQLELGQELGQAIYFPREDAFGQRPGFPVALEGHTYFSVYVVTQPHAVEDERLVVVPQSGGSTTPSPLGHAPTQAVALSGEVKRALRYRIYVVPVLVFMAEGPDNTVQAWGIEHGVATLFTADRLVERLAQIVRDLGTPIYHPPHAEEIARVMAYLGAPERPVATIPSRPVGEMTLEAGIAARQVVIQRADVVNVYTTGGGAAIDGP